MTTMRCLQPPVGRAAAAAQRHRAAVPVLETARLTLRAPLMEDFPLWAEIWRDPSSPHAKAEEAAWDNYCTYIAGWLLHGHGLWAVERRTDGALLGFVLLGLEWGDEAPELGWALGQQSRGEGYAAEAAAAARDFAIDLIGPGRVVSYIAEGNGASHRVAERIGATRQPNYDETTRVYRHGEVPEEA